MCVNAFQWFFLGFDINLLTVDMAYEKSGCVAIWAYIIDLSSLKYDLSAMNAHCLVV